MAIKEKILVGASIFTISLAFAFLLTLGVWQWEPVHLTEFSPNSFQVLTPIVKVGGTLKYRYHYCKFENYKLFSVKKQLLDGQIITLTDEHRTPLEIGCGEVERSTVIPNSVYPDTYRLKITSVYQINPIRQETVVTFTQNFTVVR